MAATGHRALVRKRTLGLFVIFLLLYLAMGARLAYVQVLKRDQFTEWGDSIRSRKIEVPASRGSIYDCSGKDRLAVSIEASSIYANRNEVEDIPKTAMMLAKMLDTDSRSIEAKLSGKGTIVWIAKKVDPRIGNEIKLGYPEKVRLSTGKWVEKRIRIPGIGVERDTKRIYPSGPLAAQVLGFLNYEGRGSEGLEYIMNRELTGTSGLTDAELDARRRAIPETRRIVREPINGKDIVLTIDTTIQAIAEEALRHMAKTYRPASACAVVLDPATGAVLAIANYPFYDPNKPSGSKPAQWRNRAVADLYEPGSTLKTMTVAAAVNEGISPHQIVAGCAKREKIKGGRITCTVHAPFIGGHGAVDMYKIIQYSCNIGAAHLAFKLGSEKLYEYEKAFGLLDKTKAGFGCEAVGYMIPPEDWRLIKLADIGFGQGIAVTPLQMAAAYAAIANGGTYVQPHVVKEIRNPDGTICSQFNPGKPRRVVTRDTTREVTKMLVTCAEEGTGKTAQVNGWTVAGKTGSAQIAKPRGGYEPGAFIASFIGYVPAYKPRLVIAVAVTRPQGSHWGATVAGPVFREIGARALPYMRVPAETQPESKPAPKSEGKGLA